MMILHTILAALGPIILGVAVGWGTGKTGFIKKEYTQALADYVIKIALPLALFLAAAQSSPSILLNLDYMFVLAAGLFLTYAIGFISGKIFFKHTNKDAAMQAFCTSFPDMAYCGPPVLLAVVGTSGLIAMVIGNLIYTVIIIPFTLLIINSTGKNGIIKSIWGAVKQPLVFLPITGAIIALLGIKLPEVVQNSINELGETAGGVALFFLGLLISTIKMSVNFEIIFNVFVKNFVQAAIILGAALLVGLEGDLLKSAFIIGILPTASAVPALAVGNKAYENLSTGTVFLSTIMALVSIAVGITIIDMI